jgi:hypothetical protein
LGVFYLKNISYICGMMMIENETVSVRVDVTYSDGNYNFMLFVSDEGLTTMLMRSVLAGGVALCIKAEDGPEKQGAAMKEVIDYLNSEFISTDSFENAKFVLPQN